MKYVLERELLVTIKIHRPFLGAQVNNKLGFEKGIVAYN